MPASGALEIFVLGFLQKNTLVGIDGASQQGWDTRRAADLRRGQRGVVRGACPWRRWPGRQGTAAVPRLRPARAATAPTAISRYPSRSHSAGQGPSARRADVRTASVRSRPAAAAQLPRHRQEPFVKHPWPQKCTAPPDSAPARIFHVSCFSICASVLGKE